MARKRNYDEFGVTFFSFQDIITCVAGIMILLVLLLVLDLITKPVTTMMEVSAGGPTTDKEVEELKMQIAQLNKRVEHNKAMLAMSPDISDQDIYNRIEEADRTIDSAAASLDELKTQREQIQKSLDELPAIVQHHEEQQKTLEERSGEMESEAAQLNTMQRGKKEQADRLKQTEEDLKQSKTRLDKMKEGKNVYFRKELADDKTPILVECSRDKIQAKALGSDDVQTFDQADEDSRIAAFQKWAREKNKELEYFVVLIKPDTILLGRTLVEKLQSAGFEIGYDALEEGQTAMVSEE